MCREWDRCRWQADVDTGDDLSPTSWRWNSDIRGCLRSTDRWASSSCVVQCRWFPVSRFLPVTSGSSGCDSRRMATAALRVVAGVMTTVMFSRFGVWVSAGRCSCSFTLLAEGRTLFPVVSWSSSAPVARSTTWLLLVLAENREDGSRDGAAVSWWLPEELLRCRLPSFR